MSWSDPDNHPFVERGPYIPSTVIALKIAQVFEVPIEKVFYLDEDIPKN